MLCPARKKVLEDLKTGALGGASKPQGRGRPVVNIPESIPAPIPLTNHWFPGASSEFPPINTPRLNQSSSRPPPPPTPPSPLSAEPLPQRVKRRNNSVDSPTNNSTSLDLLDIQLKVYSQLVDKLLADDPHFDNYALLLNDFLEQKGIEQININRMKSLLNQTPLPSTPDPPNPIPHRDPDPRPQPPTPLQPQTNPSVSSPSPSPKETEMPFSLPSTLPQLQTPLDKSPIIITEMPPIASQNLQLHVTSPLYPSGIHPETLKVFNPPLETYNSPSNEERSATPPHSPCTSSIEENAQRFIDSPLSQTSTSPRVTFTGIEAILNPTPESATQTNTTPSLKTTGTLPRPIHSTTSNPHYLRSSATSSESSNSPISC